MPPARCAHVFDAFGEPPGRVKAVRDRDFLLARPLARRPIAGHSLAGRLSLRIGVPNAELGSKAWKQPKLLGLFSGSRSPGADPRLARPDRIHQHPGKRCLTAPLMASKN